MSVTGTANPGRKVKAKGHLPEEEEKDYLATAGPDGRYGATLIAPDKPGVNTFSVSSTDATTTSTFAVRESQKKRPWRARLNLDSTQHISCVCSPRDT